AQPAHDPQEATASFGPDFRRPNVVTEPGDTPAVPMATDVALNFDLFRPDYSRPRVSDDNAFAEALFRTAKYRPEFPSGGFADLVATRDWAASFVQWYNVEHRHSGIRYVSPAQRHAGHDKAILAARHQLYLAAQARHPARWSGQTRNWAPCGAVTLNPERDHVVSSAEKEMHTQQIAA
ncbi:integrase core domain-containing protein, partial [Duganella sp. CF458]|uniref:integrase core domain-containing protein n=1 Tax=Duganella sp. CF458 TaxID=1884368 RepID=UPI001E62F7D4